MKRILTCRLKRTHQEKNGQALIFVVLVLFSLVCLFALTINVGHRITGKIEMQNAADASAMTAAVWNARGLNMISVLNVSMTECLALIIMFKAFDSTLKYAKITVKTNIIIAEVAQFLPYVGFAFKIWLWCLKATEKALETLFKIINDIMQKAIKPLWNIMKGLRYAEIGISYAAPAMGLIDASRVAKLNGAHPIGDAIKEGLTDFMKDIGEPHALLLPVFDRLPVRDDADFKDLCNPTKYGGPGYRHFLCWDSALGMEIGGIELRKAIEALWWTTFCIIPPPALAWRTFLDLHYTALCTGRSASEEMKMSTADCNECSDNNGESKWQGKKVQVSPQDHSCTGVNPNAMTGQNLGERKNINIGTIIKNDPCVRCLTSTRKRTVSCNSSDPDCTLGLYGQGTKVITEYFVETWTLKECIYKKNVTVGPDSTSNKPAPLMLADNWQERMNHTAITIKIVEDYLSLHRYEKGGEEMIGLKKTTWGIGRAQIYNPSGSDLFNQDWRVKMVPCDLENLNLGFGGIRLPESISKFIDKGVKEILIH